MAIDPYLLSNRPVYGQMDELFAGMEIFCDLTSRVTLLEPTAIEFPPAPSGIKYHFIIEGHVSAGIEGGEPMELGPGDLAIIGPGTAHRTWTHADAPRKPIVDWVAEMDMPCASGLNYVRGEGELLVSLICGRAQITDARSNPLWRALPPMFKAANTDGFVGNMLELAASESTNPEPGSRAIIDRLAEAAVLHAIRDHAKQSGVFSAVLNDPEIGAVLTHIHERPASPWTLRSMASVAGLSRSQFVHRFTRVVGEAPGDYLTSWRMHRASKLLANRAATVAKVAEEVGYASEASFSRAFRRVIGRSPSQMRAR